MIAAALGLSAATPAPLFAEELSAPVIVTQPVGQSATGGETVVFTVVAAGSAPLAYQWQAENGFGWLNLDRETSASLTLSDIPTFYSGVRYRCRVTNSQGTAYSNAATLTVASAPELPAVPDKPSNPVDKPDKPATPSTPSKPTAPATPETPDTNPPATPTTPSSPDKTEENEDSNIILLASAVLAILAALGITFSLLARRRKHRQPRGAKIKPRA